MSTTIPFFDFTVDSTNNDSLRTTATSIVEKIKQDWPKQQLRSKLYQNGITNKLMGFWCDNGDENDKDDQVLVRVYGEKTEKFIDRTAEKNNMQLLHKAGCAPQLYATFANGIAYGFVSGRTLDASLVREEKVWRAVVKEMAKMHKIKVPSSESLVWAKIRNFLKLVPESFENPEQQARFVAAGDKSFLTETTAELESSLSGLGCPLVFSHNDILLANIIWKESRGTAHFIDYEYGCVNYQPFDIGNHFNEFAGLDEVDYSLYPDQTFQYAWLRAYLSEYHGVPEEAVKEEEVRQWYAWVNKFSLVSHFLWSLWAFVQAANSDIDFDFFGYGLIRLGEFKRRKTEFMAL